VRETEAKNNVVNDYKTFAASKGLKIEENIFEGKSSVMIAQELQMLKTVSASVAKPSPVYLSIPDEFMDDTRSLTVGMPDGNGNWIGAKVQ
jgi:hypothetical protein